ncbi:MAG: 50S ribosomal protein L23 [Deltaproteobacteria bacterium]|nr:50S ribosomal protein L23 [Deltaproteobacteria bacterium]
MKEIYACIRRPIVTEKSSLAKETATQYVFEVDQRANKVEIKNAVQRLFNVTVQSVNVMNFEGKRKRMGRLVGKRPDWKKAVITLKKGDSIEYFEGV